MSQRKTFPVLVVVAAVVTGALAQQSKPARAKAGSNPVTRISLPSYPGEVLQGPNVEVFKKDCLTCHTARYVNMQPNFSRGVWEKEVKKMIDAYGATVPEADQAKIVDYLVAVRGVPESKPAVTTQGK